MRPERPALSTLQSACTHFLGSEAPCAHAGPRLSPVLDPGPRSPARLTASGQEIGESAREKAGLAGCCLATLPDRFLYFGAARVLPGLLWVFCVDSPRPRGGRAVGPGHSRWLRASEPPGKR